MEHRPPDWQSFPIQQRDFPPLALTNAIGKKERKGRGGRSTDLRMPSRSYPSQPAPPTNNVWHSLNETRKPSNPEWSEDDVNAANQSISDTFHPPIVDVEKLKTVVQVFTDRVTTRSRFNSTGYPLIGRELRDELMLTVADPCAPYRSLVLTKPISDAGTRVFDKWLGRAPNPSLTPRWEGSLPDRILNDEFTLISFLRHLDVSLGPKAIEVLKRECRYNAYEARKLPFFKPDHAIVPLTEPSKKSLSQVSNVSRVSQVSQVFSSWSGPSNDVRLSSAASTSSSQHDRSSQYGRQHDRPSQQYIRQNKPTGKWEHRNSNPVPNHHKDNREDYPKHRDMRYRAGDTPRACYDYEWDDEVDYDNGSSQSSHHRDRDGYGRRYKDDSYRSERADRSDYDYREDSGYHAEYDESCDYGRERDGRDPPSRSLPPAPTPTCPIEPVRTPFSRKTPVWKVDCEEETSGKRGNPSKWRGQKTWERPILVKEKSSDEMRNEDPDARHFWVFPGVSTVVRKAFRCLEGVSAGSSTAFADDMHRVELSTWSGEEDAVEVAARLREKYRIGEMEKENEERRVKLALPKTSITLSVGAGGEADIIFDGDCTDVLVRGMTFHDVEPAIDETFTAARTFDSYSACRFDGYPIISKNTLITFGSIEESRSARERLGDNGVDAKKIPRDLITGNWDGSYAKRECLLDLEWERHGTHGFSIRFKDLYAQNNLVDQIMRNKSEYFTSAHMNMEEPFNRLYVAVPSSPFPVDDDIKFLKRLLDENGVEVVSIFPLKGRDGPQTIEDKKKEWLCTYAINRRMLKVAIEEGVWGGFHPRSPQEWEMMLDAGRFAWVVEIDGDKDHRRNGDQNSARVRFDSYEQGERIAAQVQRMTPTPGGDDRFILNKEDRKGVFARAKLRVHYNVPVFVHALTSNRLTRLDERWRAESYFSHAHFQTDNESLIRWTCLISDDNEITPPGFCRLIVEGFPKTAVEDACAQLMEIVRGDVIKCDGEEQWLLTGIGRNMADEVAKEAIRINNVLVDFNVLGKEIRLMGERCDTTVVETRLRNIARKRDAHVMETLLTIHQPLYMNRVSDAIRVCGGLSMVENVVGECRITPCPEDPDKRTVRFEGTVASYDRFRDFLGDLDDTLRASAKSEYEKQRKTNPKLMDPSLSPLTSALVCPICSCRPSIDFYRLEACGHIYCTQCIYHQLHSELSTRTLPLTCRRAGCDRKLAVSDLLHLLLGRETEGAAATAAVGSVEHLDELKLRPLVTAIVTNALQTQRDRLIACRTADCAGIFPRSKVADSLHRCKTCERTTCGTCGYEPHRGVSCEEYEKLRDNVDVSLASYMKNKKVRKCPNTSCSAVIEKTVGCNHMECVICRTHFCWLCAHSSRSQGEIYAHMQNEHGGNGLHMDDGEMFMLQFD